MTTEEKSESINFDNEQEEQRTLGSDEERKIKPNEENKINNKNNEVNNKSQNKSNKKKLPPIKKSRKDNNFTKVCNHLWLIHFIIKAISVV